MFLHPDLKWKFVASGTISILSSIFGILGLFAPKLLDWSESPPFVIKLALLLLVALPIIWIITLRRHARALFVYHRIPPVRRHLTIEIDKDLDSTMYYALLRANPEEQDTLKIQLYPPSDALTVPEDGVEADVFVDPITHKPLVIQIGSHRLWSMAP